MNAPIEAPSLGAAELQKLLTDIDSAVLLIAPRLLRRVIKQDCEIGGVGLQVPHRKTYVIRRETLLAIVDRGELGVSSERDLPDHLILLGCPEDWLIRHTREQALMRYWRLLFHARIDQELERRIDAGEIDEPFMRAIMHRVGFVQSEEAFRVLRLEDFLLPPSDIRVLFTEFVAVFLELRTFARPLVKRYFPSIEDQAQVEAVFAEIIDPVKLLEATRPAGAPDPKSQDYHDQEDEPGEPEEKLPPPRGLPSSDKCKEIVAEADESVKKGNVVRSAVLRMHAADVAPPEMIDACRKGALADIDRLVSRLQAALELHDREAEEWRASLPALLGPASHGMWPPSLRLLYDLQKVCIDHERDLYAIDLVEWVVSLFRKPIKRAVPLQAEVLLVKHLRSAAGRLARARIADEDRRRIGILLRSAIHHCEDRLRDRIRPLLTSSLEEVGFRPENQAETVALRKIVEELLDRVTERGFLNMGDVRDAVSRNQLKMYDTTLGEAIVGDKLLKANRKLAIALDGVFHRGEVYLRWLQRFSSLLFGTPLGRLLTLYLILPIGGAFALLVFWQEISHIGHACVQLVVGKPEATETNAPEASTAEETKQPEEKEGDGGDAEKPPPPPKLTEAEKEKHAQPSLIAVGCWSAFLFLIMHVASFRHFVWDATCRTWKLLRIVFVVAPMSFFALPAVHAMLASPIFVFFRRRILSPLLLAASAAILCIYIGIPGPFDDIAAFGGTFLVGFLLLSTRLGRDAEEAGVDWVGRNWYWLRIDFLPGLMGLIIVAFKEILDRIERILYTVDEWFRFRPGDGAVSLFYKPILGLFWFFITYGLRVIVNLFIEPTVNPLKHFPAVTVGAKLIIPMYLTWTYAWTEMAAPYMGYTLGRALANTIFVLLPGICGFAVWEFKENWKLYRATRRRTLAAVPIGHHGETMLRFLKPGFHSGTLPRLFARFRRAERRRDGRRLFKIHEAMHHNVESIRHFLERELVLPLELSERSWNGLKLIVGEVKPATNCVRIELRCPDLDETACRLSFADRSGRLIAGIDAPGWLGKLNEAQKKAFGTSLAGLYKLAGVSMVREQIAACLPSDALWTIEDDRLLVFLRGDFKQVETRALTTEPGLIYESTPIAWDDWVSVWQSERDGKPPELPMMQQIRLLPTS